MKERLAVAGLLVLAGLQSPARATQEATATRARSTALEEQLLAKMKALVASREFDRAERLLDDALRQGADPVAAYFAFGKACFDQQEWARSAQHLEKSLQLDDSNDQAHLLLGLTWRQLKRPDKAEAEFMRAVALNPRSDLNAYFAGHQLVIAAKYEAALPYLYRALELNARRPEAFRAMAIAQAHVGNYGLAESYYRKAIGIAGDSEEADYANNLDLAFLLLLGHDPARVAEGLDRARRAAKLRPDAGEAHYLVGKALFKLGRFQEAVLELQRAKKLSPEDSKPCFLLARTLDRLGRREEARAEREALARAKRHAARAGVATGNPLPASAE